MCEHKSISQFTVGTKWECIFTSYMFLFLRAPHTVRSNLEKQEGQLSQEEQEKRWDLAQTYSTAIKSCIHSCPEMRLLFFCRTEAASSVLKNSAGRQRSYVLSAAKIYEYVNLFFNCLTQNVILFLFKYNYSHLLSHEQFVWCYIGQKTKRLTYWSTALHPLWLKGRPSL